jgi:hypothetical protein
MGIESEVMSTHASGTAVIGGYGRTDDGRRGDVRRRRTQRQTMMMGRRRVLTRHRRHHSADAPARIDGRGVDHEWS